MTGGKVSGRARAASVPDTDIDTILEAIPDTVLVVADGGRRLRQLTNESEPFEFTAYPDAQVDDWQKRIAEVIATGDAQSAEYAVNGDAGKRYLEIRFLPHQEASALMVIRDVTTQHRAKAKVYRLAFYDVLTGLPNRQAFLTQLSEAIRDCKPRHERFHVLYLDVDNFKRVNDTLGHTVGDALLKTIAARIESCVRAEDSLARPNGRSSARPRNMARLGGDEFTLLLKGVEDFEAATAIADRVRIAVSEPIRYDGREFVFTSSTGIVCYPDDGADIETLLANADMAMYGAKDAGKNTVRSFSDTMSVRSLEHLDLENDLRQCIAEGGLELHYQPKRALVDGRLTGFEALCRWQHPERGAISPEKFIHIAVESGMIHALGDWVLNEACRQLNAWQQGPLAGLPVAINLSGEQLSQSDIFAAVSDAIQRHGIAASLLELELTESELMRDANRATATLAQLKDAGVSIAVDDFGTGYSSLAYLKRFPIDSLKIDRSFAPNGGGDDDNVSICSAIVALAHSLQLKVIAEGVETAGYLEQLKEIGCDEMQGYFFARPMPPVELEAFVADLDEPTRQPPILNERVAPAETQ